MSMLLALGTLVLFGAQAITPQVRTVDPAGGQRGTEVTIAIRGERLGNMLGCLVERPGIEVVEAVSKAADRAELRLRLLPDCPLGLHPLRLRTARGCSNLFLFSVTPLPCVREQRDDAGPQPIALGSTVEASLRGDDIDRYRIEAAPGTLVCCEIEAWRLGQQPLDLELAVASAAGPELVRVDDAAPGGKDPWCECTVPAGGAITVSVRAAVPAAGVAGVYRLHVGTFARPVGALPCGGQPGEVIDVLLLDGTCDRSARVALPDDGRELFAWVPETEAGSAPPTPIWLRVGGPPNREPTVDAERRQWLLIPGAVHGVVAEANAASRFHFRGQKGKEIEFRVVARSLRSPLDPVLAVRAADGRLLAQNDDAESADSVLRFQPPADGAYLVEVRDLLRAGSLQHFFRLEAGPRLAPTRVSMLVQRQVEPIVTVPQGGHGAAVLQLQGSDARAVPVITGLPAGVAVAIGPRLPGQGQVPVLFTAAADAPLDGALLSVAMQAGDAAPDPRPFVQLQPLLLGRNNVPLVTVATRRLALATSQPAPWRVRIDAGRAPLIRGSSLALPVAIDRSLGYSSRLRVRPLFAPPGLAVGQTIVDAGGTSGTLLIEASADAPLGESACLLSTIARVDGAVFEHALPFLVVRVEEPWLRAEAGKARTTAGRDCELRLALAVVRPATAAITALLTGLPRGVAAAEQRVAADGTVVAFALRVGADAALGRHRLQVELHVPGVDGVPMLHRFAAGELRIDAPRVVPVTADPVGGGGR